MTLTTLERVVNEGSTATFKGTLKDEDGTVIPSANLDALTLTLYNAADGTIINSRNAQNVLNANNVTVHATSGLVTWEMQQADNAIQDTDVPYGGKELHVALFEWQYDTNYYGKAEVLIEVRQINKVT